MTNPITPEVRAAIARLQLHYLGPMPPRYSEPGGEMLFEQDREQVLRLALSLFPPGMPEPVEMWCPANRDGDIDRLETAGTFRQPCDTIRGLFIPLDRVER